MAETQAAFHPSWGRRIAGMEGLRAFAAIAVLVGHVQAELVAGVGWGALDSVASVAIQGLALFFALSGFLLYRPFASALLAGERWPSLKRYATNRALRIYPAYLVILGVVALVLGLANRDALGPGAEGRLEQVGYLTDPGLLVANATMLHTLFPLGNGTGLGVAWSLTVELVFYIVMPALALGAFTFARRRPLSGPVAASLPVLAIFAIGMVGIAARFVVFRDLGDDYWYYNWGGSWEAVLARSFPVHASNFAFGMAAAVVVSALERKDIPHRAAPSIRIGAIVAAAVALGAAQVVPGAINGLAVATFFSAILLYVAIPAQSGGPGRLATALEWLPIRYIGLISYSIYLWHYPVIWFVANAGWVLPATPAGFAGNAVIVASITIALSSVTYYLVERPALARKRAAVSVR